MSTARGSTGWKGSVTTSTASSDRHSAPGSATLEAALADAERRGFRLAVIGRTCALFALGLFYVVAYPWPNNLVPGTLILVVAAVGLVPLALAGSRWERGGRYAFFAFDVAMVSAVMA